MDALKYLRFEVRSCFRTKFSFLFFAQELKRNFVLVELSVTGKSPGRSPTSKYLPFFNVPATTFVSEYPQFIESML